MHAPLKKQLVSAQAEQVADFLTVLFNGGDVGIFIGAPTAEIAEFAERNTNVGDVYVPVDDPGNEGIGVVH